VEARRIAHGHSSRRARGVDEKGHGKAGRARNRDRHLARGTLIEVLGQRHKDSWVEVRLVNDRDTNTYLVPSDAIDTATAQRISIHRPPRHRRSSGGSRGPVDWKVGDGFD
jgi:hypothetical protein